MKRFKRVSIVLTILIILVWTLVSVWIIYPANHMGVSSTDIEQTKALLEKSSITVPDSLLEKGVSAIACPAVVYRTADAEKLVSQVLGSSAIQTGENTYTFEETELHITGTDLKITGKDKTFEDISINNAAGKAKKLIEDFKLGTSNITVHTYERENGYYVTVVPEYKGKSVFDCIIKLTINNDSSYILETTPVSFSKPTERLLPSLPCSVLSELAIKGSAKGKEVTDMNLGYKLEGNTLRPVWEIITDDENAVYIS